VITCIVASFNDVKRRYVDLERVANITFFRIQYTGDGAIVVVERLSCDAGQDKDTVVHTVLIIGQVGLTWVVGLSQRYSSSHSPCHQPGMADLVRRADHRSLALGSV